jgi:hypothetical protein
VSHVRETRYRLLLERLQELTDHFRRGEPIAPAVLKAQTVRLLVGVIVVLRQHQVNKRGRCKYCGRTRRTWRLWYRRPLCTVYLALDFAMSQPLDLVWQRLQDDDAQKSS